ncbi:MAG: esterase family protein [Rhodothermales bacterium]|nr:esterase family protein [Rhodothermales bacterium]MBO6781545.1 esterase family protein [Rhodothermales bacterium]
MLKGVLLRHNDFESDHVGTRNVHVWLPEAYDAGGDPLPVLYMQDGQNLFEPEFSFAGVTWGVAETVSRLIEEEGLPPLIVVGIWNTSKRIPEYMPERPMADWADPRALKRFGTTWGDEPCSDGYLRFMVDELKPFIDDEYNTASDRDSTWLMGSSMGGLISLYALCEYPAVFGAACCLSTSWTVGGRVMIRYLERHLPESGAHRLYFDYGVEAQIARYEALQNAVNRLVRRRKYRRDEDWITRRFPGAAHDEAAWKERVDVPLRFLLERNP